MCLMVGHMMGMELVEFPSATSGRGVLSMVITCVSGARWARNCYVPIGYYWARSP